MTGVRLFVVLFSLLAGVVSVHADIMDNAQKRVMARVEPTSIVNTKTATMRA